MRATEPTPAPARPEVTPPGTWSFPAPRETRLDNGLTLLVHEVPGQHVISVRVVVPLSLSDEPREVEGVATLTARLLDEGTERHTADELAGLLERAGVALGAGVVEGALNIDLDVPSRFLPTALDLLTEILTAPAFPEEEVRRARRARLAHIAQETASAPHRAARQLIATLYAASERASRPTGGSPATVAAIERSHVVDFYRTRVGPRGATLVVAGDLSGHDVTALVAGSLGEWSAPAHELPGPPVAPVVADDWARVILVDRPGAVQSEISVARPGPDRHVEGGWAPYPVLSFIVGGSPNARVDAVLREEKGYTYGIRSSFRPRVAGGSFVTSGSVRSEVTAESVRLLVDLLGESREGFTDEEVRAGTDFVALTAPGRYATADTIADETATLAMEGLPLDSTTATLEATRRLDAEQLRAAYGQVVDGRWAIVVVGDAAQVREPLAALGLGPVTVVPAEGDAVAVGATADAGGAG